MTDPHEPPPRESGRAVSSPSDPTGEVFVQPDDADPREEASAAPRRSGLRTAGVVSARAVVGIIVIATAAIVLGAASVLPLPGVRTAVPSTTVTSVPTAQQLVCPGGLLRLASATGSGANTPSSLGDPAIASAADPGGVLDTGFSTSDANTGNTLGAPRNLRTPPTSSSSGADALIGGAQSESIGTTEFTGLASAACADATAGTWLVGGSTTTGRTTLVLLANPTDVQATVNLQVFGENGAVTAPGMDGIAVAPDGQRVLSLAGFAPGLISPVVHVQSTGGQILANLEQTTVRGLTPGGIDFVGGETGPATTTVIPGVLLSGTAAVQSDLGQSGFDDLQTTLRIYLPGSAPTTASVSVISESGQATGKAIETDLEPGVVTDLPLDELSDGSYTIRITCKVPLVASVRVSTAGSAAVAAATDFAWLAAAPMLTSPALIAVAPNMSAALNLYNPTAATERVGLRAIGGTDLTATVPAHSATSVPVPAGASYVASGYAALYASVTGMTDGGVTGYVISPSARGETPVRIYR